MELCLPEGRVTKIQEAGIAAPIRGAKRQWSPPEGVLFSQLPFRNSWIVNLFVADNLVRFWTLLPYLDICHCPPTKFGARDTHYWSI